MLKDIHHNNKIKDQEGRTLNYKTPTKRNHKILIASNPKDPQINLNTEAADPVSIHEIARILEVIEDDKDRT